MGSPDDELARTAVGRKLVTAEQMAEARREHEALRAAGQSDSLKDVLVRRNLLDSFVAGILSGDGVPLEPSTPTLRRYEILGAIGQGTMAVVYRARDASVGRFVAVKVLWPTEMLGEDVRERFLREARVTAGLTHPNVVAVYDVGEEGGRLYLVMELVEGRSLRAVMEEGKATLRELVVMLEKVARGVGAAHRKGIVHRDVKPANILVSAAGEPKVGDFGLAHVGGARASLTKTGVALGTPMYMAPEQVRGRSDAVSPAMDVYALGTILYEMVTGRVPVTGDSVEAVYERILHDRPASMRESNPKLSEALDAICLKALEKDPARRYPDGEAFAEELRRWLKGEPVQARRPWFAGRLMSIAIVAILVVVVAGIVLVWRKPPVAIGPPPVVDAAEAHKLLERARPALDRAQRAQYDKSSDYDEAIARVADAQTLIERALEGKSDLAAAHYLLGRAWELRGWLDKAEASWRRAIELDPRLGPAHYQLGRALMARAFLIMTGSTAAERDAKRPIAERLSQESRDQIRLAMAEGSGFDDEMLRDLADATVAYGRGDGAELRAITLKALERYTGREGLEEFHFMLALAGQGPESDSALDKAIGIRPRFALARFVRGNHRHARRDADGTLEDYAEALRVCPRFSQALANRCGVWITKGQYANAIDDADAAIALGLDSSSVFNNRGFAKRLHGDLEGAVADHSEAIVRNPQSIEAHANRAIAYYMKGMLDEAIADCEKSIQLGPHWSHRHEVEERLTRYRAERADKK